MPAGERVLLEVHVIFLRQVLNKLPVAVVVVLLPEEASRCKSSNTLAHTSHMPAGGMDTVLSCDLPSSGGPQSA